MAICRVCTEEYSDARLQLGFTTCQHCGDLLAREEALQKSKRVGPIWNKGPDMYLGSPDDVREILKTAGGRKNIPVDHNSDPGNKHTNSNQGSNSNQGQSYNSRAESNSVRNQKVTQTRSTSQGQWEFDHWEFPVDKKTGIRYKRAVLRRKDS